MKIELVPNPIKAVKLEMRIITYAAAGALKNPRTRQFATEGLFWVNGDTKCA